MQQSRDVLSRAHAAKQLVECDVAGVVPIERARERDFGILVGLRLLEQDNARLFPESSGANIIAAQVAKTGARDAKRECVIQLGRGCA